MRTMLSASCAFQLTRPLRGATIDSGLRLDAADISTHTPLAGRDAVEDLRRTSFQHFNSHAPCGARPHPDGSVPLPLNFNSHAPCGARRTISVLMESVSRFQLTRPLRGATRHVLRRYRMADDFNSHAPCGARQTTPCFVAEPRDISTHTPLAGRDTRLKRSEKTI